jgi:hypothetical protein
MFSPNSQKSSSLASNSNGNSPAVASSPDALVATTGVLSVTQQLSSGTTNDRVSPLIFLSPNAGAPASSRRSSSVSSGRTTPTEMLSTSVAAGKTEKACKNKSGREKGTYAYNAEEHSALLKLLMCKPNSFNSSESLPEWRKVHKDMIDNYYLQLGVVPRASSTLHSHFVELYSAFKQGVRSLLLVPGAPKCPSSVADEEAIGFYVQNLFQLLISDMKKYQPKKWWSMEVTSLLLCLHLSYMKSFGNGDQTVLKLAYESAYVRRVVIERVHPPQRARRHECRLWCTRDCSTVPVAYEATCQVRLHFCSATTGLVRLVYKNIL